MRRTLTLVAVLVAALALVPVVTRNGGDVGAGGTGAGGAGGTSGVPVVAAQTGLTPFEDCGQLLEHLREKALEQVTPWGLGGGPIMALESDLMAGGDGAAEAGAAGEARAVAEAAADAQEQAAGGAEFSTTNVQVAGIDESDIVKTDGRVLAVATWDGVTLLDVTTPTPRTLAKLRPVADAGVTELFLDDDRLVVISTVWGGAVEPLPAPAPPPVPLPRPEPLPEPPPRSEPPAVEVPLGSDIDPVEPAVEEPLPRPGAPVGDALETSIAPAGNQQVAVVDYDLADPTAPEEVARLTIDGSHLSSRLVDGRLLVVTSSQETTIPFVFPSNPAGEERALELNRQAIREAELEDFLPSWTRTVDGQVIEDGRSVACDRVYHPDEFGGLGTVQVTGFDAAAGTLAPTSSAAVVTSGQTVYASPERLYVTTTRWDPAPVPLPRPLPGPADDVPFREPKAQTDIHAFAIADLGDIRHVASGAVPGNLLNQFSLSEHDGDLRVAVTTGQGCCGDDSQSSVHVLRDVGGELREIGAVGGLGRGERIFAVRFLGDVGYVVTFRQVDPLYTIDLSDPTAPRAVGELKIPGYSAYLHPLDDEKLLGVGQDADLEGRVQGLQVSLFDVSDLASPQRLGTASLPGASTPVEHDHRAFLWWPTTSTAAMPFVSWRQDERVTAGTAVFTVDPAAGELTLRGTPGTTSAPGFEYDAPQRAVIVDGTLWAVGERTVQGFDLATLRPTGAAQL